MSRGNPPLQHPKNDLKWGIPGLDPPHSSFALSSLIFLPLLSERPGFAAVKLMLKGVEPADVKGTIKHFVEAVMIGLQSQRLTFEDFAHKEPLPFPIQIPTL